MEDLKRGQTEGLVWVNIRTVLIGMGQREHRRWYSGWQSEERQRWGDTYPQCSYDEAFEYADNVRVCLLDDAHGVAEYQRQADAGCCGSTEVEFDSPWGRARYGFNYGH